jgi:NAD-dependent dihydropyrimidine dehydrogenase PreA subunit
MAATADQARSGPEVLEGPVGARSRRDLSRPGHEACTGCALCLLPCPVWWQTHDPRLTPMGRARALQGGAAAETLVPSVEACVLCGACEPICPERIDTVGMTLTLRQQLVTRGALPLAERARATRAEPPHADSGGVESGLTLLLTGPAEREMIPAILRHLGESAARASDDGHDLSLALEVGLPIDPDREQRFLSPLASARRLVVAEGLMHRFLRERLPRVTVVGIAEALLAVRALRAALRPTDLLAFEPRGYHADFTRLVRLYDELRRETGCLTNLDLHRLAIPTGAGSAQARLGASSVSQAEQARWILEGRAPTRVVVESEQDRAPFARALRVPVVHLAELA